jgi:hypothetical protein
MVARALTSLSTLIAALVLASESSAEQLKIIGMKDAYSANAPIPFTLTKQTPDLVTFAVAAEVWDDGRFHEIRWDIFSNALKVAFRRPIEFRKGALELSWDVPRLTPSIRPRPDATYRLRIDVLTPQKEQIYSQPFLIRKTI